ncbi:MAG TPA: FAD-binding oxidoreductase [Acidimicrobiales bacterium]
MDSAAKSGTADVVVVGGGTVGAWCAWYLRQAGAGHVVLLEAARLGQGASSRAAGMVRAQGGTEAAVRLGIFCRDFYRGQQAQLGIDSGFVEQGYYMPCFTQVEVDRAHERIAMQQALGLEAEWIAADEVERRNPNLAKGQQLGSSFCAADGYLDPPTNVRAYTAALFTSGVDVRERTAFTGLRVESGRVVGVETSAGPVSTPRVVLTGGPSLAEVGGRAGIRVPAGGVRHQVVVTEPHPDLAPERLPMVFDVASGIYWRPEEGGLMWGMSNPDEVPGEAKTFDWDYYGVMAKRIQTLLPVTAGLGLRKVWAATIEYTPDHLPILGPGLTDAGPVEGSVVACAAGHGIMWGPGVARAAADLALTGSTDVLDVTDLGLDRFDEHGNSRLAADPIALPYPDQVPERTIA